ncbi:glycosyltransferase family 4 protein [Altericroceibacterium endophyticum]|uniref:Glycosyltransferase n=1 Tax=Altericroceibacterium endophyticum TaxID=1808508 RepID=A0A6I4T529_9SPHN|nr:glycosyltransferase family 4 protein [Altericroceibacterium endophyticum]MXO66344.1 glycosyltransferase [Altericroceibacterium endophyticum]
MIRAVHLLDDFAMGGVTRSLLLHERPELASIARSTVVPVAASCRVAPHYDADLIITHFPPSWKRLSFLASLRLRNPKARLIHVEHSYTKSFEARRVAKRARFRTMLTLALSFFDEILCVSQAQADWLEEAARLDHKKPIVINPWSNRAQLLQVEQLKPLAKNAPLRLAAYGRFAEPKNFLAAIQAVRRFQPGEVELHLGGTGPDEEEMRASTEGCSSIHFHGMIDDVPAFLGECDALIVPSEWEAFGLVATEARLAARPILVANVDGLPEQVGEAYPAGLVAEMRTPDDIERAIRHFRTLPLSEMGWRGRQAARNIESEVLAGWRGVYLRAHHGRAANYQTDGHNPARLSA